MKHVQKSILLWYGPQEMYALVTDIARYPEFLPWCERAEVLQQHDEGVTARLTMLMAGMRHAFTTRNVHDAGRSVLVRLVDGPFSVLEGSWQFRPVGRPGADADAQAEACRIEFELRYAFSNRALEALLSGIFDRIANSLVDAFVTRAEAVYGAR